MRVVICEDHTDQLSQIKTTIQNYAMIEANSINVILSTTDVEEVLKFIQNEKADCYVLTIDLGKTISGLELAEEIRNLDPIASIVFITTHNEMLHLPFKYKIAALDYIIKDENILDSVIKTLKLAYKKYKQIGQEPYIPHFQIKVREYVKNIPFNKIYFFEASTNSHKIILHAEDSIFEFYGTLKKIYTNLDSRFYRCHKSFH